MKPNESLYIKRIENIIELADKVAAEDDYELENELYHACYDILNDYEDLKGDILYDIIKRLID